MRKSCACIGLSRAAYYRTTLSWLDKDAEIIRALNELVEKHARWGFWKCYKALKRQKCQWNHKRVYRVYCQMNLNRKRRAKRKLPKRIRQPLYVPPQPNLVWSADFVSDALYVGNRFRAFTVIDDFNREAITVEVDTSIRAKRLIRVFEQIRQDRGLPKVLRVDNGPEFLSGEFVAWAESVGMKIQYIEPGEPNQNAYIERFNRTYREEVLDLYLFSSIQEVRETTYWWLIDYNENRPHDSLGDLTPAEYLQQNAGNSTLQWSL